MTMDANVTEVDGLSGTAMDWAPSNLPPTDGYVAEMNAIHPDLRMTLAHSAPQGLFPAGFPYDTLTHEWMQSLLPLDENAASELD
jgi:hypothetical protein